MLSPLRDAAHNMGMRLQTKFLFGLLFLAIAYAGASLWMNYQPIGPIYENRPLKEWLKEQDDFDSIKKHRAQQVVDNIGTNGIPDLISMLRLKDPQSEDDTDLVGNWVSRRNAAYTLGRFGPQARGAIPQLERSLNDRDPRVRYFCAEALGRIGPRAIDAIPKLMVLKASDPEGGIFADWAIEEIQSKPHSEAVLKAMAMATTNESESIAEPAVIFLRDSGNARLAVPTLVKMLSVKGSGPDAEDDSWGIYRIYAADRIALLGANGKEAVEPLIAALSDHDPFVRVCIAHSLGEIGPEAKPALPLMLALLNSKDVEKDKFSKGAVKRAIQQIDPEVLPQAEAK